jgi:hypothetical protein
VADYVLLVPSCVGLSRLGKTLGRMGFALMFVIAIDYAPSRKSICDLSLTHIVLFITIDNATIGMSSWWLRVRCLNLFIVIGSLALSSPISEFWACYIAVTGILRRAAVWNLILLRSSHQKLFKQ